MEPENHLFEKGKASSKPSFFGFQVSFQGCSWFGEIGPSFCDIFFAELFGGVWIAPRSILNQPKLGSLCRSSYCCKDAQALVKQKHGWIWEILNHVKP